MALVETPRGEMVLHEIPPRLLYTNCSLSSTISSLPVRQSMLSSDSIVTVYKTALDDSMEFKINEQHLTHPTRPLHPTQDFPYTYSTSPLISPKSCSPLFVPSQRPSSSPVAVLQTEWTLATNQPNHVAYVDVQKLASSLRTLPVPLHPLHNLPILRPVTGRLPEPVDMSISDLETPDIDMQYTEDQLFRQAVGRSIGHSIGHSILASRGTGAQVVLPQPDTPVPPRREGEDAWSVLAQPGTPASSASSYQWHTPTQASPPDLAAVAALPEVQPQPQQRLRPMVKMAKRPRKVKDEYKKGGALYHK